MSPECQNCGHAVTPDYVRVFAPDGAETVRACPNCPDRVRARGGVRDARSARFGGEGA